MQAVGTYLEDQRPVPNCLIVEDSAFDREKLTRVLQKTRETIEIEVASSLRAARQALAKGRPTLILLDNNLPDGLGANFALELSENPMLADIPIILVSDWPSPFMWEKAEKAGVSFIVSKTDFDAGYVKAVLQKQRSRRLS